MPGRVAFVCALPMELSPLTRMLKLKRIRLGSLSVRSGGLAGGSIVAIVTGMGTARAASGVTRLLDAVEVDRVVVVGIAGGVSDAAPIGTLVVPREVVHGTTGEAYCPDPLEGVPAAGLMWTSDDLITDEERIAGLVGKGVIALDMETAAVAEVCRQRSVPWSALRVISDRAGDDAIDEAMMGLTRADGTPDLRALCSFLVHHPGRIPGLVRTAIAAGRASHRAARAGIDAVSLLMAASTRS